MGGTSCRVLIAHLDPQHDLEARAAALPREAARLSFVAMGDLPDQREPESYTTVGGLSHTGWSIERFEDVLPLLGCNTGTSILYE